MPSYGGITGIFPLGKIILGDIMSYTSLLYHIVFRTHCSVLAINEEYEKELYKFIYGFVKGKGCVLHRIGGMPDHIHLLLEIPPTYALSDFMRELKISARNYIEANAQLFPKFNGWAKSYAAFTYAMGDKDVVKNYIKNQKEHHRRRSWNEEMFELFREYGLEDRFPFYCKEE